jgi:uncharacterized protein
MITEGYLLRHCNGKMAFRDAALIDVAQDHALRLLHAKGLFELGLVFKGGTALRKYRMGSTGRFSTDLDFAAAELGVADLVFETLDGAEFEGFTFAVEMMVEHRRAVLRIGSHLGSPKVPARIDITHKAPWLVPELATFVPLPIHSRYGFALPPTAIMRIEEVLAEKLARYRRVSLARDLYDLAWFAKQPFDENLVRRLAVLKVWTDVVQDSLGTRPFEVAEITRVRKPQEFDSEAIGYLTMPVDMPGWITAVCARYEFMRDVDAGFAQFLQCNPRDVYQVRQAIQACAS